MKKHNKSDFRFIEILGKEILTIQSDRINDCMEFFASSNFDGIYISRHFGYELTNLDFLNNYSDVIKKIKLIGIDENVTDISALVLLTELKSLRIRQKDAKVDLSCFKKLEKLNISGMKNIQNLESCKELKSLTILYFNPKSRDFTELPAVDWIEDLTVTNSNITTLCGLEKFKCLRTVSLANCVKLRELCCLDNSESTLTSLQFETCKKIINHAYVESLKNLETLAFNECGLINSLSFLNNLLSLKSFRFVGTDVLDGNLNPVLRLDHASFSKKRHFSHSMEEVKLLYEERTGKKRII